MTISGEKWEKVVNLFRGINAVNLDTKGRIAMPKKYRQDTLDAADGKMVVTIDTDAPCLLLYTLNEWERIESKLQQLPSFNPAARRIQRLLIGHAMEVDMDAQGRLLLPGLLRDHAGLDKNIILVGQGNKFEIWSQQQWDAERESWLKEGVSSINNKDELPGMLDDLSV
ncbi:division/cell wall cluster transcriptional repressor MraZ [Gammaproteobacteria bacterium]|nr:division/cell wall cluster transcriptional repressor MraZ [Gammaproteobacteria bacterium]